MPEIHLTYRAIEDLQGIYEYSANEWGALVADNYLKQI